MNLLGKSATGIIELIRNKTVSAEEVFSYFYKRIKRYDKELNAFITVDFGTPGESVTATPEEPSALLGLPIAVKDNFCTQGVKTTAASKVLKDFIPPYESTVTSRLKSAGMTMLGKTNMDAWAHGSSTETSDFGSTKNPWDTSRVPGGSSGGSAAAVAAGLAPAAIGSETAGSIRQPAAWCGIVGLKPTYGRVSRYGVVAMGSSFDCPGPMTNCVEDAALLLSIIAGRDEYDATSSAVTVSDYQKNLKNKNQYIVGVPEDYFENVDGEISKSVYQLVGKLDKQGHKIKKIKLMHPKYAISVYTILQRSEVSSNLARYTGVRYGNGRSFFGEEAKRRIMLGTYTLSHGYYDAYYKKAAKVREVIKKDFEQAFSEVDFMVAPTAPMTALKLGEWEKYPFFGEMMDVLNEPAAVAGLPAISLPIGRDTKGLPIGMQIMAKHFDEKRLLNMAWLVEQETGWREKWESWVKLKFS